MSSSRAQGGMPTKGERGKATDFSIAAIMAPRGPSFGHYHLQGIGNAAATANTSLECPASKGFMAGSALDDREYFFPFKEFRIKIIAAKIFFCFCDPSDLISPADATF